MNYKQNTIKNKAYVSFDILGKCHVVESNEVEAKKIDIQIIKEQSRNVVLQGEKICYKIIIYNNSCVDIFDLDFKDTLESDICYQRNTFKVNNECKNPEIAGRTLCYHINKLKAKEEMVITFDTEVV